MKEGADSLSVPLDPAAAVRKFSGTSVTPSFTGLCAGYLGSTKGAFTPLLLLAFVRRRLGEATKNNIRPNKTSGTSNVVSRRAENQFKTALVRLVIGESPDPEEFTAGLGGVLGAGLAVVMAG